MKFRPIFLSGLTAICLLTGCAAVPSAPVPTAVRYRGSY
jgi:hypothetical protein